MQSRILGGSEMMHGGFLKSSAKVQLFFDICKREHKKGVGVTPFRKFISLYLRAEGVIGFAVALDEQLTVFDQLLSSSLQRG